MESLKEGRKMIKKKPKCLCGFMSYDEIEKIAKEKGISAEEVATMGVISNKSLLKQIKEAEKDLKEGNILTHNQVFDEEDKK